MEKDRVMSACGDDDISWDQHWTEHKDDIDFHNADAFDYFRDLLTKDFKVLEIGCGSCKFYPVFKLVGCGEYVGVDFSPVATSQARAKFPDLKVLLMRAEEIDFDAYFDLVFSNTFLQHTRVETKNKIFPRVYKALKQNGLLVFQENPYAQTATTFLRENWISFTESFGFKFLRATLADDARNGFVFRVTK
jgi:ubiquinone/menaquinone biosynthesis C-methylase UbiE